MVVTGNGPRMSIATFCKGVPDWTVCIGALLVLGAWILPGTTRLTSFTPVFYIFSLSRPVEAALDFL